MFAMRFSDVISQIKQHPTSDWLWNIDYDLKKKWAESAWEYIRQLASLLNKDGTEIRTQQHILTLIEDLASSANWNENSAPNDFDVEEICNCLEQNFDALSSDDRSTKKARLDLLSVGVRALGSCNNPAAIETLLLFVRPNIDRELEERVTEFSLDSIKDLVMYGSEKHRKESHTERNWFILPQDTKKSVLNAMVEGHLRDSREDLEIRCNCGYRARELPVREYNRKLINKSDPERCDSCDFKLRRDHHSCGSCSTNICSICIQKTQQPLFNREKALEIMRFLNDEIVIEHILRFANSENSSEVAILLKTLDEHWKDEYLQHVEACASLEGARHPTNLAIRILGKRGGQEHVLPLIDQLQTYSKLDGKGFRNSRDAVEEALVGLRAHSAQVLEKMSADVNNSKGFQNTINRVLRKIDEAQNVKERSATPWISMLFSWRTETFEAATNMQYPFQVLSDDHIWKIYERQPLTYEDLMDFEIGAYKVNKYGHEILEIVRKNQPYIAEKDVAVGPWQLPIEIRDCLEEHLKVLTWQVEIFDDATNAIMMKGLGAHTKGQLRKIVKVANPSTDQQIVEKTLDMVLKTIELEGSLAKFGQKRGVRYALLKGD